MHSWTSMYSGMPRRPTRSGIVQPGTGTSPYDGDPLELSDLGPIVAPNRTNIGTAAATVQPFLAKYKPVNYTKVSGINDALGDDYFDLLEQQATKKLQEKFFNAPDSLARQQQMQMNKRGLIGSGLEAGASNQLYKTFGDELVDIQSNLAQKQLETQKELAFRNKDIEMSNASQVLASQQKNREFEGFLSEIGLRAAADEAKTATDFDTRMFEQQVKQKTGEQEFVSNLLDRLNTALQNEKIDKGTRQIFEDLFGSQLTSYFGKPGDTFGTLQEKEGQSGGAQWLPTGEGRFAGEVKQGQDGKYYSWNGSRWVTA